MRTPSFDTLVVLAWLAAIVSLLSALISVVALVKS